MKPQKTQSKHASDPIFETMTVLIYMPWRSFLYLRFVHQAWSGALIPPRYLGVEWYCIFTGSQGVQWTPFLHLGPCYLQNTPKLTIVIKVWGHTRSNQCAHSNICTVPTSPTIKKSVVKIRAAVVFSPRGVDSGDITWGSLLNFTSLGSGHFSVSLHKVQNELKPISIKT